MAGKGAEVPERWGEVTLFKGRTAGRFESMMWAVTPGS